MKRITITLAVAAIFTISARGQGFLNLDFESAYNLPVNVGYGTVVPTANALPDWTAYDGDNALSQIFYASNIVSGTEESVALDSGSLALNGNFSVELFLNSSISQTGMVPADTESLELEAYGLSGASGFSVTLGGETLSYTKISEGPNYNIYGANIPGNLDGQMEPLSFICQGVGSGQVVLDNIEFSTTGAPEPAEWALIGLGVIMVGLRSRRKQARPVNLARFCQFPNKGASFPPSKLQV